MNNVVKRLLSAVLMVSLVGGDAALAMNGRRSLGQIQQIPAQALAEQEAAQAVPVTAQSDILPDHLLARLPEDLQKSVEVKWKEQERVHSKLKKSLAAAAKRAQAHKKEHAGNKKAIEKHKSSRNEVLQSLRAELLHGIASRSNAVTVFKDVENELKIEELPAARSEAAVLLDEALGIAQFYREALELAGADEDEKNRADASCKSIEDIKATLDAAVIVPEVEAPVVLTPSSPAFWECMQQNAWPMVLDGLTVAAILTFGASAYPLLLPVAAVIGAGAGAGLGYRNAQEESHVGVEMISGALKGAKISTSFVALAANVASNFGYVLGGHGDVASVGASGSQDLIVEDVTVVTVHEPMVCPQQQCPAPVECPIQQSCPQQQVCGPDLSEELVSCQHGAQQCQRSLVSAAQRSQQLVDQSAMAQEQLFASRVDAGRLQGQLGACDAQVDGLHKQVAGLQQRVLDHELIIEGAEQVGDVRARGSFECVVRCLE